MPDEIKVDGYIIKMGSLSEEMREKLVDGALDSLEFLEQFSADKNYQQHLYHIKSLLIATELCLSIERHRNHDIKISDKKVTDMQIGDGLKNLLQKTMEEDRDETK